MIHVPAPADLAAMIGADLGVSSWFDVTQERVDSFAQLTGDRQWIHVDPERAGVGPYGGPVAHGMLLLALLPSVVTEVVSVGNAALVVNKGITKARFAAAVHVGQQVRGRVTLASGRARPRQYWEAVFSVDLEVAGTGARAVRSDLTLLYAGTAAK
jgi:acyl dehydratase